jgi:hypothetical protein
MVAGNLLIRKDLLSKYLRDIRRRLSGTPKEADVSLLIDYTEQYIRTKRQHPNDGYGSIFGVDENFKVERASSQAGQEKTTDYTILDASIPDVIGEDYVFKYNGKIPLYIGDLKNEDSLIDWIKSNQNIKFVDNSEEPAQTISWLGNPNKTNEIKNILIEFLIARSTTLLQRESNARRKQLYKIYNDQAKALKSNLKQQIGSKNSTNISQESMNKLLTELNKMWPFAESGGQRPTIRMQRVEMFFDNMTENIPDRLQKFNKDLGRSIQDEDYLHIMRKISPERPDKANFVGYLGSLNGLVNNLKSTLEAIDDTISGYYSDNAAGWSSKLKEQILFCTNFQDKIDGVWEREAMLNNL